MDSGTCGSDRWLLSGVEYNGTIFGCHSLCVVSVGTKATEDGVLMAGAPKYMNIHSVAIQARIDIAKIETVFNEVVQLERTGDVFGKVSPHYFSHLDYFWCCSGDCHGLHYRLR